MPPRTVTAVVVTSTRRAFWRLNLVLAILATAAGVALGACGTPAPTPPPVAEPSESAGVVPPSPAPSPTSAPVPTPAPVFPSPSIPPLPSVDPCGEHGLLCGPFGAAAEYGIPFTPPVPCSTDGSRCQLQLDLFWPTSKPTAEDPAGAREPTPPTGGWPVVVAVPGGPLPPGARGTLSAFADTLARQGAVVVTADYRSSADYGGGYPQTFADVACAIRRARELAPTHGGNPSSATLVSHSFGGWPSAVVALTNERFRLGSSNCLAISGSPRPDAYVGVASIHSLEEIAPDFLAAFLGGTEAEVPEAWAAVDPVRLAPDARPIPISLVAGANDLVVTPAEAGEFANVLDASGLDWELEIATGADHTGALIHPVTFRAILGREPVTTATR